MPEDSGGGWGANKGRTPAEAWFQLKAELNVCEASIAAFPVESRYSSLAPSFLRDLGTHTRVHL